VNIEVLESPQDRAATDRDSSEVIELRQYTLHPGRRDELITLFEREFVESQQAVGMRVIGTFRDLDAPDRFVWLRGFPQVAARATALAKFYGGPVWKAHRDAANATMIDSDDVLLLRAARPAFGFMLPAEGASSATACDTSVVVAHIHYLRDPDPEAFTALFERVWIPLLWNASVAVVASYVTAAVRNEFPALPVRESESVFVWFSQHQSEARAQQAAARIDEALDWSPAVEAEMNRHLSRPSETLRLAPTARSLLRG
jgi:hypothetical protein